MADDDDLFAPLRAATRNDSEIVRETLRIYGSLYLVCLLIFAVVRRVYPKLYNVRSWASCDEDSSSSPCRLARHEYTNHVSWLWEVFKVSDVDLQEECGMDAVCFLRALRFGRKLALVGCVQAIWLIPMYRTAEDSVRTNYLRDPFVLISVSNLPSHSPRFVGTIVAAYILYGYAMYLILAEYRWFTTVKHKFLSRKVPRNYAVYVSGIPAAYRSSRQLANYFDQCSKDSVLEAQVVVETPRLDKLVARRAALIQKLEHAVALQRMGRRTEVVAPSLSLRKGLRLVESVPEFQAELERLNQAIAQGVTDVQNTVDPPLPSPEQRPHLMRYTASKDLLRAIQEDVRSDPNTSTADSTEMVPSVSTTTARSSASLDRATNENELSVDVPCEPDCVPPDLEPDDVNPCDIEDAIKLDESDLNLDEASLGPRTEQSLSEEGNSSRGSFHVVIKSMASGTTTVMEGIERVLTKGSRAAGSTLVQSSKLAGSAVLKTSQLASSAVVQGSRVAVQTAGETSVVAFKRAQMAGNHVLTSAGAVVPLLLPKSEGKATDAGFVVFTSLYATQTALQMVHHPRPCVHV
jgi:Late exocytosis, associated with Golgi transport/Cytosolic domain of 10TM putative phosphate transporter